MDLQHALELADEIRDGVYDSLSSQALIFLADYVLKLQATEEYWRFMASKNAIDSQNAIGKRCELCADFDTVIHCINGCHEKNRV